MLPVDPLWFPILTTLIGLAVLFVISFAQHTVILRQQRRDLPPSPSKVRAVPEDEAWHKRQNAASRSCWLLLLMFFPGIPIYLLLWAVSTTAVFGQLDGSTWQAPAWWSIMWTMVLLGVVISYIFRPWRSLNRRPARAPVTYPDDWDDLRREVYARDGYRCANCGATDVDLHAHHIVPLSVGGTNERTILVTLCQDCHQRIHPHMCG